jgi:hypothetical protein
MSRSQPMTITPVAGAGKALTLAEIRTAVDAKLAELWPVVQTKQAAYLASRGRYWQGIRTIAGNPPEDAAEVAVNLAAKPSYQAESWADFAIGLPATLGFSLRIDTYSGPQGKGYVGTVEAMKNGVIYDRAANVGPETWRAHPWQQREAQT